MELHYLQGFSIPWKLNIFQNNFLLARNQIIFETVPISRIIIINRKTFSRKRRKFKRNKHLSLSPSQIILEQQQQQVYCD